MPSDIIIREEGSNWRARNHLDEIIAENTPTFCLKEALAYAYGSSVKRGVEMYGGCRELAMTGQSIPVPAQTGLPFRGRGCHFRFDNTTQDGFVCDSQSKSEFDNADGSITYSGSGFGFKVRPVTAIPYVGESEIVTPWAVEHVFRLGRMEYWRGKTTVPDSLLCLDPSGVIGSTQYASSSIVDCKFFASGLFCMNGANTAFRILSPTSDQQVCGENLLNLGCIQGARSAEICYGMSYGGYGNLGPYESFISTNELHGVIAHSSTIAGAGGFAVICTGQRNRFQFRAMNSYSGNPNYLVYWAATAYGNRIIAQQAFGWGIAIDVHAGSASWPNTIVGYDSAHPG